VGGVAPAQAVVPALALPGGDATTHATTAGRNTFQHLCVCCILDKRLPIWSYGVWGDNGKPVFIGNTSICDVRVQCLRGFSGFRSKAIFSKVLYLGDGQKEDVVLLL